VGGGNHVNLFTLSFATCPQLESASSTINHAIAVVPRGAIRILPLPGRRNCGYNSLPYPQQTAQLCEGKYPYASADLRHLLRVRSLSKNANTGASSLGLYLAFIFEYFKRIFDQSF
jgi:hypothetical protein